MRPARIPRPVSWACHVGTFAICACPKAHGNPNQTFGAGQAEVTQCRRTQQEAREMHTPSAVQWLNRALRQAHTIRIPTRTAAWCWAFSCWMASSAADSSASSSSGARGRRSMKWSYESSDEASNPVARPASPTQVAPVLEKPMQTGVLEFQAFMKMGSWLACLSFKHWGEESWHSYAGVSMSFWLAARFTVYSQVHSVGILTHRGNLSSSSVPGVSPGSHFSILYDLIFELKPERDTPKSPRSLAVAYLTPACLPIWNCCINTTQIHILPKSITHRLEGHRYLKLLWLHEHGEPRNEESDSLVLWRIKQQGLIQTPVCLHFCCVCVQFTLGKTWVGWEDGVDQNTAGLLSWGL